MDKAIIREDILRSFPRLFGTKTINNRKINVEQEIAALAQELHPEIAAALTARQSITAFSCTGPRKIFLAEVGRHI